MIGLSLVLLVLAILVLGGALALFGGHFLQGLEEFVVAAQTATASGGRRNCRRCRTASAPWSGCW